MYRKGSPKQTANASCTEGISSIPKLLALENSYWYADEVANVPVRIFTNHLLVSCIYAIKGTQARLRAFLCVKLCTEEFLTFCGWFQPTSFLTAFFHKLWIPLHLNSQQGAQGPLVSLVPMKTLTLGCENVPAWCTWMTYPICWGHSWWSYSYPLVFYGIRPTQEPACRHSVISWSRLIEQYWFFF